MATTTVELHVSTAAGTVGHDDEKVGLGHVAAPEIKLNGKDFPKPKDGFKAAHGFQVIAIDAATDMTDPRILVNEYHYLPKVRDSFGHSEVMYRQMIHALLSAGDPGRQRVFIVSFGMAANAPPPVEACKYLIWLGAGKKLQGWVTGFLKVDPNDYFQHKDPNDYIPDSACYVLVGSSGLGYGQGIEGYSRSAEFCDLEMNHTLHNPQPAPRQPHPVHVPRPAAVT